MMSRSSACRQRALALALSFTLSGCATMPVPYTGLGPHPQLERGAPVPPIDFLGNVLALPMKLLLLHWSFANHRISPATEEALTAYLDSRALGAFEDTKFRLNQYKPGQDLSRLVHNDHVAWPYRLLLGLPLTLLMDVLLPGRLVPWGDYYNPFTNTVHLYSDHPAVSLHEAGHAYDFAGRKWKGTYATLRLVPFVDLYQEYKATDYAIDYLKETRDHPRECAAYKILYPAYGSYVGGYLFFPFNFIPIALGHLLGRAQVATHCRKTPPPPISP